MIVLHVLVGLVCGALGGLLHLLCVAWRARAIVRGHGRWAFALYPLGLLAIAGAVMLASGVAPLSAWLTPLGIIAARAWALRPNAPRHEIGAPRHELAARSGER